MVKMPLKMLKPQQAETHGGLSPRTMRQNCKATVAAPPLPVAKAEKPIAMSSPTLRRLNIRLVHGKSQ